MDDTAARARARGWRVIELDRAWATGAGAARAAGMGAALADRVLLVDGDVAVEPGYLDRAMRLLDGDPRLAGVGGQLRFDEGRGVPPHSGAPETEVDLLAALALYRAGAVREVGGFVPWLESEEDADLGLRLRRTGHRLQRVQPGGIHRSGPRGGLSETFRRFESGLYHGQGRVLRLRWGSNLFQETLVRQRLYLGVILFWSMVLISPWLWALVPLAALGVLVAQALRKNGLGPAFVGMVTWHVMAVGLLAGWISAPPAKEFRVARDSAEVK